MACKLRKSHPVAKVCAILAKVNGELHGNYCSGGTPVEDCYTCGPPVRAIRKAIAWAEAQEERQVIPVACKKKSGGKRKK